MLKTLHMVSIIKVHHHVIIICLLVAVSNFPRVTSIREISSASSQHRQLLERLVGDDHVDTQKQMKYNSPPSYSVDHRIYDSPLPPTTKTDGGGGIPLPVDIFFGGLGAALGVWVCSCLLIACRRVTERDSMTRIIADALAAAAATADQNTTQGLDQQVIDTYPTLVIDGSGQMLTNMDDKTCSICLSDYEPLDVLKIMPQCLHRFHAECVDEWMLSKAACPICRIILPKILL